jgi:adenosylcobinamide-GDP ribazoletransferase
MTYLRSLVMAFSLYSRIPMPHIKWDAESKKRLFCFFPAVGAAIAVLLLIWTRVSEAAGFPLIMESAIYVAIPYLVSGGIHFDGFLDVTDAIASCSTREKRLAIMKDPHTGAFAVSGGIVWFLVFYGCSAAILQEAVPGACFIFIISRGLSGLLVMNMKSARPDGMLSGTTDKTERQKVSAVLAGWAVLAIFLMMCVGGAKMILPGLAGIIWTFLFVRMAQDRFGGITGDLAGYFLTWCELIMTVAFAAVSAL